MPEVTLDALFARVKRRWHLRALAHAIAVAGATFAVASLFAPTAVSAGIAVTALAVAVVRAGSLSDLGAAVLIERVDHSLENIVVTAAELRERPRPVHAWIAGEIQAQAVRRASAVNPERIVPLGQPVGVAAAVVVGCLVLAGVGRTAITDRLDRAVTGNSQGDAAGITVRVTPPAYARRPVETFENPMQVSVLAGSRVAIEAGGSSVRDWVATASEAIELTPRAGAPSRFLAITVIADSPPRVRVVTPGKDTAFAEPKGRLGILIESDDDLGLAALSLSFTKASGGGENVAFSEGEIPLRLDRVSERQWRGTADVSIEPLALADGDIVVYRAVARDTNPAGRAVASDQYVIEIGKNAEIADAGFSLPSEERKYAISQQMVIYKTEQLIKARAAHRDTWLEETRGIGVEQRMVRAEVVFLGGGEVEDEVEEASRSDELTEGRLQNTGRVEMLNAINAMSRAEAQLNDGRAEEALVFERQALASLERALDRRRYFLRTLPDRSRIDTARRLTGEWREARSWTRDERERVEAGSLSGARSLMRELAAAAGRSGAANAALAARVAALDPSSPALQRAAVAIASASSDAAAGEAIRQAMAAVTAHVIGALPGSSPVDVGSGTLGGVLAGELARRPQR